MRTSKDEHPLIKTRTTELFGIKYPIFCGGMFWLGEPNLCAAISNAGGMGNITAVHYANGEELRAAICQTREMTDKPFSVNITMLPSRMTRAQYDEYFRVCCEEKVTAIEATGEPAVRYIQAVHQAGIKIIHKVGSVRHALHAEKLGYDAVYAAGFEEGGHPLGDDVATTILTARVAESVKIPVITAGGIADGRGLAAALSLGADGVMMATRFMATDECIIHNNIKQELVRRQESDTVLICKTLNLQGRALKSPLVEQVMEIEKQGGGIDRLRPLITGQRMIKASATGEVDEAVWHVGQTVGLIKDIVPCRVLLDRMVSEAAFVMKKNLSFFK
jgi:Dioxygenases related to 2-nitropropane dioxygenase